MGQLEDPSTRHYRPQPSSYLSSDGPHEFYLAAGPIIEKLDRVRPRWPRQSEAITSFSQSVIPQLGLAFIPLRSIPPRCSLSFPLPSLHLRTVAHGATSNPQAPFRFSTSLRPSRCAMSAQPRFVFVTEWEKLF